MDGTVATHGRASVARRTRHGSPERAHVPGLAGRLSADRAPWFFLLLRRLHSYCRLDVQSTCEVAEGDAAHPLAEARLVSQLSAELSRLASGPQRLQPPGPRLH